MRLSAPSVRRALAVLYLGLFASAWMLDAHHRATVPHVRCAADGAIAHGDHDHAADPAGSAVGAHAQQAEPRPDAPALVAAGEAPEAEHDHCGLPDLGRTSGVDPPARPLGLPALARVAADRVAPGAPARTAVAVLDLAPKQSPPRG